MGKIAPERLKNVLKDSNSFVEYLHIYRYSSVKKYLTKDSKILDIACGTGYGSVVLDSKDYLGIDVDPKTVEEASKNYGKFGKFEVGNALNIDKKSASFDAVISLETIEHISREKHPEYMDELLRVLKPGGYLAISTPNKDYSYKKRLIRRGWTNPYHKVEYSTHEFLRFLESYNDRMNIIDVEFLGNPWNFSRNYFVMGILAILNAVGLKFVGRFVSRINVKLGKFAPLKCKTVLVIAKKSSGD